MKFDPVKALRARVIFLSGPHEALRRRWLEEILAAVPLTADDFDVQRLEADKSPFRDWIGLAGTPPFLAPRRAVIVRHVLRLSEVPEGAAAELARLPESALLVLVADEEPGGEWRASRRQDLAAGLAKAVEAAKGLVLEAEVKAAEAPEWLRKEAASLGKSLEASAAAEILAMVAGDLDRAREELEKLVLYVGERATIRKSDVAEVVSASREWRVFEYVDAVVQGDAARSLAQLRALVDNPARSEELIRRDLLRLVSRQLRMLWQAQVCRLEGCSLKQPSETARALMPSDPDPARQSPWLLGKLEKSARSIDLDRLSRSLSLLADAEAALKGLAPSIGAVETVELMTLRMLDVFRPGAEKETASGRRSARSSG